MAEQGEKLKGREDRLNKRSVGDGKRMEALT
jgi:hypothetical protein